tara:strand:+ start:130 stop:324 length:195 start_codon:yes stop_codon:yes gene_type:complete
MKENQLYLSASIISVIAFLVCAYYITKNYTLNYQNTIIIVLGLLSLSKSVEYYEKHIFKLTTEH